MAKTVQRKKIVLKKPSYDFIHLLDLKNIRLVSSASALQLRTGKLPRNSKLSVTTKFGKSSEDETLGGELSCEVTSTYEGEREPAIYIQCAFQMIYTLPEGAASPTEQQIKSQSAPISAMLSIQAWPYVRQHVQDVTAKMGLPPLVLQPLVWSTSVEKGRLRLELHQVGNQSPKPIEEPAHSKRKSTKSP